ncbi:MAG TPA: RHS repeat-associated core domain-containing protein, partial [Isosphaeraceae bacterium]|nr:RHS repeat-associated core domain-containing protein [Isosphaeraceae bacterium]
LETVTYKYDVFGNRIEEDTTSGSSTQVTRFAYDGQNIWADLDGNNNLVTRRLFQSAVDAVIARISASGTVAWYLTDRLGSVRVLTDNTGSVIDEINYDAYGNILTETNPSASDRYLWTGQQFDALTGLQYNQARYYDPATGRWTSEDPIGFAGGDTNLYRYVGDDPVNKVDPSGLADLCPPLGPPGRRNSFPNREAVERLIKDLDANNFQTRRKAADALDRLILEDATGFVENRLKQELASKPPLELRLRIEGILNRYYTIQINEKLDAIKRITDEKKRNAALVAELLPILESADNEQLKSIILRALTNAAADKANDLSDGSYTILIKIFSSDDQQLRDEAIRLVLAIYNNAGNSPAIRNRARFLLLFRAGYKGNLPLIP